MIRATLLALSGIVSACQADETVASYGAADREWTLVELNGAAFTARATLTFGEDGRISGQAPCNRYSGTNTVPYPWFKTGPVAATKMACPDLGAESAFFTALDGMTQSEVLEDTLVLRNEDGAEMVFKASD